MESTALKIIRRPLTAACWRETLYLLIAFVMATAAFSVVVTGVSVSLGLAILVVGLPIAVGFIYLNRLFCNVDRRLVQLVRGEAVPRPYRPVASGESLLKRCLGIIGSAQTWRDIAWMLFSFPVAVSTFCIAVTAWATSFGLLTLPIWWQFSDSDSGFVNDLIGTGHFQAGQLAAIPIGMLAMIGSAWLVRGCALAQTSFASALLGPGRGELEERVETLTSTRAGAVDAAVTELQRVERDLHDGAQARLVALNIDLGMAEQKLAAGDDAAARAHLAEAREQAQTAMGDLRDLVRGIGPSILRDRGLQAALNSVAIGTTPPVDVQVDLPPGEPDAAQTAAYFVCLEAMTNATKHAAASQISVRVNRDDAGRIVAEVTDDGHGGADPARGTGLEGLRKRVAALDGSFTVTSPAGGPTTVRAEI